MMAILAIDPGNVQSAFAVWDGKQIIHCGIEENESMRQTIEMNGDAGDMVIEMFQGFGMPVGAEVFETVYWIGRFCEVWSGAFWRVFRKDVKMHLCGSTRAKDSNIRQALIDRFGSPSTKANPNPVYGEYKLRKDMWQAFALAVFWWDREIKTNREP